jgi:hypothetical protein
LWPSAKRTLPVESSSTPPKRLGLDRKDNGDLYQPESYQPRTLLELFAATYPKSILYFILSTAQEAAAMLNQADCTGGKRTLKLARGPGSGPNRTSRKSLSRGSSDHSVGFVASHEEGKNTHSGAELLSQVGIIEFLEQDERPTFIVDLADDQSTSSSRLNLLFVNPALKAQPSVLESIEGKSDDLTLIFATSTPHRDFKSWVLIGAGTPGAFEKPATPLIFAGFTWKSYTIRNCLRIIHGDNIAATVIINEKTNGPNLQQLLGPGSPSPRSARDVRPEAASYFESTILRGSQSGAPGKMPMICQDSSSERTSASSQEERCVPQYGGSPTANGDMGNSDILTGGTDMTSSSDSQKVVSPVRPNPEESGTMTRTALSEPGFFDWTRVPLTSALPLHIQFARSIDWGATSLGSFWQFAGLYMYQILLI